MTQASSPMKQTGCGTFKYEFKLNPVCPGLGHGVDGHHMLAVSASDDLFAFGLFDTIPVPRKWQKRKASGNWAPLVHEKSDKSKVDLVVLDGVDTLVVAHLLAGGLHLEVDLAAPLAGAGAEVLQSDFFHVHTMAAL